MKKRPDLADLAATLSEAASKPLVPGLQPARRRKSSIAVFLKVPIERHATLEYEAVARTKETGKGVTVQQIILERLERLEKLEGAT